MKTSAYLAAISGATFLGCVLAAWAGYFGVSLWLQPIATLAALAAWAMCYQEARDSGKD